MAYTIAPPPVTRQAKQLQLPLDAYASSVAETHLVEDAQDVLVRRCRKDRGMEWKALPRVAAQDSAGFSLAPGERGPDFRNVGQPDGCLTFHRQRAAAVARRQ
ncbi:hypothetical protein ACFVJH_32245 [Streptomyces decoyicus]|uniref:hypothetical protein n=1 Tax=Streptomyces decoyicus TaxID=249567 RepID=UPI003640CF59